MVVTVRVQCSVGSSSSTLKPICFNRKLFVCISVLSYMQSFEFDMLCFNYTSNSCKHDWEHRESPFGIGYFQMRYGRLICISSWSVCTKSQTTDQLHIAASLVSWTWWQLYLQSYCMTSVSKTCLRWFSNSCWFRKKSFVYNIIIIPILVLLHKKVQQGVVQKVTIFVTRTSVIDGS